MFRVRQIKPYSNRPSSAAPRLHKGRPKRNTRRTRHSHREYDEPLSVDSSLEWGLIGKRAPSFNISIPTVNELNDFSDSENDTPARNIKIAALGLSGIEDCGNDVDGPEPMTSRNIPEDSTHIAGPVKVPASLNLSRVTGKENSTLSVPSTSRAPLTRRERPHTAKPTTLKSGCRNSKAFETPRTPMIRVPTAIVSTATDVGGAEVYPSGSNDMEHDLERFTRPMCPSPNATYTFQMPRHQSFISSHMSPQKKSSFVFANDIVEKTLSEKTKTPTSAAKRKLFRRSSGSRYASTASLNHSHRKGGGGRPKSKRKRVVRGSSRKKNRRPSSGVGSKSRTRLSKKALSKSTTHLKSAPSSSRKTPSKGAVNFSAAFASDTPRIVDLNKLYPNSSSCFDLHERPASAVSDSLNSSRRGMKRSSAKVPLNLAAHMAFHKNTSSVLNVTANRKPPKMSRKNSSSKLRNISSNVSHNHNNQKKKETLNTTSMMMSKKKRQPRLDSAMRKDIENHKKTASEQSENIQSTWNIFDGNNEPTLICDFLETGGLSDGQRWPVPSSLIRVTRECLSFRIIEDSPFESAWNAWNIIKNFLVPHGSRDQSSKGSKQGQQWVSPETRREVLQQYKIQSRNLEKNEMKPDLFEQVLRELGEKMTHFIPDKEQFECEFESYLYREFQQDTCHLIYNAQSGSSTSRSRVLTQSIHVHCEQQQTMNEEHQQNNEQEKVETQEETEEEQGPTEQEQVHQQQDHSEQE